MKFPKHLSTPSVSTTIKQSIPLRLRKTDWTGELPKTRALRKTVKSAPLVPQFEPLVHYYVVEKSNDQKSRWSCFKSFHCRIFKRTKYFSQLSALRARINLQRNLSTNSCHLPYKLITKQEEGRVPVCDTGSQLFQMHNAHFQSKDTSQWRLKMYFSKMRDYICFLRLVLALWVTQSAGFRHRE